MSIKKESERRIVYTQVMKHIISRIRSNMEALYFFST